MVVFGILLTIYPEVSGIIFTRGFATVVLLFGLLHLWRYTRARKFEMGGTGNLIAAILLFILSAIGFFKPEVILSFLPFCDRIFVDCGWFCKDSFDKRNVDWRSELRWSALLSAGLPLVLGIILASYPFSAATLVIRVFGIFLLVDGISDIVRSNMVRKNNF